MRNLQSDRRILKLPRQASINIWLFSNTGQEPDCDVVEIPNEALTFLWETARMETYRQEIESFLHSEPKRLDYQLMECIKRKAEYNAFYPYKSSKPASKGLFELYQTKVLGNQILSLKLAEWLSVQIKSRLSSGDKNDRNLLTKLLKENAYGNKDKTLMVKLKGLIAQLAEEGLITLEEYTALFPGEEVHHGLLVKKDAFKWIWFYLNHEELADVKPEGGDILFTHPLIKTFARDTFDYYLKEKGLKYIKRNIIDEFKKGEVKTLDMQRWFINLAEIKEGYTNEIWDDLCRDENGNNNIYEVRFQLRLEMANLYRLAIS